MKDLQGYDLCDDEEGKEAQEGRDVDLVCICYIVGISL